MAISRSEAYNKYFFKNLSFLMQKLSFQRFIFFRYLIQTQLLSSQNAFFVLITINNTIDKFFINSLFNFEVRKTYIMINNLARLSSFMFLTIYSMTHKKGESFLLLAPPNLL